MLPDYPKVKGQLVEAFEDRMRMAHFARLGIFNQIQETMIHEGERNILYRDDGSMDDKLPRRIEGRGELTYDHSHPEKLQPEQINAFLDKMAENLAEERIKGFFECLDKAVTEVGNVSHKKGVEGIFDMIEKIQMDFDQHDKPIMPTMMVGSNESASKVGGILREIMESPDLRRRYETLIDKKRDEWRDREIARNLGE